jgi:hypothetical protein
VCGQLEGDEDQHKKIKKGGKLNMDGCLKLLTQDEIFKGIEDWHKACDEEAEAELKKKEVKVKYDATCETWKVLEVQQKVRNNALLKEWEKDMRKWQEERESTKYDHQRPRWKKPRKPKVEKMIPKPKKANFVVDSNSDGVGLDEEEEEDEVDTEEEEDGHGSD